MQNFSLFSINSAAEKGKPEKRQKPKSNFPRRNNMDYRFFLKFDALRSLKKNPMDLDKLFACRYHKSWNFSMKDSEKLKLLAHDFNSLNQNRLFFYTFLFDGKISMEGERIDSEGIENVRGLAERIFHKPPLPEFFDSDLCRLLFLCFNWLEEEGERNSFLARKKQKEGKIQEKFPF
jgi:hypothetical protein